MPDSASRDSGSGPETPSRSSSSTDHPSPFRNPLPGDVDVWQHCALGPSEKWSESLQSFAVTLASFMYPACILKIWGEDLVLLHNEAWLEAGGGDIQGQRLRGSFTPDAWEALQSALHGGEPKRLASHHFLDEDLERGAAAEYTVLISPLFEDDNGAASGLLTQLLPKSHASPEGAPRRKAHEHQASSSGSNAETDQGQQSESADVSKFGEITDSVALDEHPFFHRFAEMLPNGLAILDDKAQAVFVNQHFYDLTTHQGEDQAFNSWPQSIHPEDYERVMGAYQEAFKSQRQLRTEFRAQGGAHPWRLLLLTPLGNENLEHVSLRNNGGFICSVVDISSEKSAELTQRKAAKEAQERKEQQERFIDMISHEIRNPLSAVLHCNEDIAESVREKDNVNIPAILEAVETIGLCIAHQKNIVDDVLSFSKLDASMLSLSPKPCRPSQQLAASLKMFMSEFKKQSVECNYRIDSSYVDSHVDWVMADLARVSQVLINLVSNAVKFTARKEGEKCITVSVAASCERPDAYPPNVIFFGADEAQAHRVDATNKPEWGSGQVKYIMVAVEDTGIGIDEEGQRKLFGRFHQATPKTEEMYGGTGLGLSISRKICHLHGGEIGVASQLGDGSTFGFYFTVKESEQLQDYQGKREDDEIELDQLRNQVKALGNICPIDAGPQRSYESLENPPVTHGEEAKPQGSRKETERHQVTHEVVSEMPTSDLRHDGDGRRTRAERSVAVQQDDQKQPSQQDSASPEHGDNEQRDEPSTWNNTPTRVLLVEDNVINQRIVSRKLRSKGFKVTTAKNGKEAIEAVRKSADGEGEGPFDVVLMDQEMPVMDGNTATKELRELERKGEIKHVPILGLTANVRGAQQDEMKHSGMNDVISKPYKIEDLLHKLGEIVGEKASV